MRNEPPGTFMNRIPVTESVQVTRPLSRRIAAGRLGGGGTSTRGASGTRRAGGGGAFLIRVSSRFQ